MGFANRAGFGVDRRLVDNLTHPSAGVVADDRQLLEAG
jgi:hypothetical protein